MGNMKKHIIFNILFWTWCFPQTLLGFILKLIYKGKPFTFNNKKVYIWTNTSGSISLGKYVLLHKYHYDMDDVIKHELGHQKQSFILGWLYLPIIGLPSLIWANCFEEYRLKHNVSYDAFYTEKWANKLGGVYER